MADHAGVQPSTSSKDDVHKLLVEIFQRFDTYGDGTISALRLTRALEKLNLDDQSISLAIASSEGTGAERINYVKFASWVTGSNVPQKRPEEDTFALAPSLWSSVKAGRVSLVRASWLVKRAKQGQGLVANKDLPTEAVWNSSDLFELGDRMMQQLRTGGHVEFVPVVCLSLHEQKPDQMRTCALVLEHLCEYLAAAFKEINHPKDCGVFFADCSLPETGSSLAESGLAEMALWYGSSLTRKLFIHSDGMQQEHGLSFLESVLSGMTTQHQMVLRVNRFEKVEDLKDWSAIRKVSATGRSPPLTPETASTSMDTKHFASNAQKEAAKRCYHAAFHKAAGSCRQLVFARLGWTNEDIQTLAKALPHYHSLRELFLEGNSIGDSGAGELGSALPQCLALQEVLLGKNSIGDAGMEQLVKALPKVRNLERLELFDNRLGEAAARSLASALPAMGRLKDLLLQGNALGDAGVQAFLHGELHLPSRCNGDQGQVGKRGKAIAAALPSCRSLERLVLDATSVGDPGAAAMLEVMGKCSALRLLHMEGNSVSEAVRKATRGAWSGSGKPQRHNLNGKDYDALLL